MRPLAFVLMPVFLCAPLCAPAQDADDNSSNFVLNTGQLQARARSGDSDAQYDLAMRYHKGNGVMQDDWEMVQWATKAAEQGDPRAEFILGMAYRKGIGVLRDMQEGTQWLLKAGQDGDINAENALSVIYARGSGVARDPQASAEWHQKAFEGYLQGAEKKQEEGEKQLRSAFTSEGAEGRLVTLNFRCAQQGADGRVQMLLVEADRAHDTVTERVLDPHGDAQAVVFSSQRLSPLPGHQGSEATLADFRLDNVTFNPTGEDGFEMNYGYTTFNGDDPSYVVNVRVRDGAITYVRPHMEPVRCTPVSAQKVKRFEEKEAALGKGAPGEGDAAVAAEAARGSAQWDALPYENKQ